MSNRVVLGALAGLVGTAAMTAVMRRLHRALPAGERYPLPPREIVESVLPERVEEADRRTATMAAHFAYGAVAGGLYALAPRPAAAAGDALAGAAWGLLVWAGSYLGWLPAAGILTPATRHPPARNALMNAAHLAWGAGTALVLRELETAEREAFTAGSLRDRRSAPDHSVAEPARDPRE